LLNVEHNNNGSVFLPVTEQSSSTLLLKRCGNLCARKWCVNGPLLCCNQNWTCALRITLLILPYTVACSSLSLDVVNRWMYNFSYSLV